MNIQLLFLAIKNEPLNHTLLVAVTELERQGYGVIVGRKHKGSAEISRLVDDETLDHELGPNLGVVIEIERGDEKQSFRLHFLDLDAIALTSAESPPVIYDERFTIDEFR